MTWTLGLSPNLGVQVGVGPQVVFKVLLQSAGLGQADLPPLQSGFGGVVEGFHQVFAVVLHPAQHFADGVPLDDLGDLVAAGTGADVHRVGVPKQVVQIPQDFLVGAPRNTPSR